MGATPAGSLPAGSISVSSLSGFRNALNQTLPSWRPSLMRPSAPLASLYVDSLRPAAALLRTLMQCSRGAPKTSRWPILMLSRRVSSSASAPFPSLLNSWDLTHLRATWLSMSLALICRPALSTFGDTCPGRSSTSGPGPYNSTGLTGSLTCWLSPLNALRRPPS